MSPWILASEKLPPFNSQVLFYVAGEGWIESGSLRPAFDGDRDDFWECERTAPQDEPIRFDVRDERVTHWMPLPEIPARAQIHGGKLVTLEEPGNEGECLLKAESAKEGQP